MVRYYGCSSFPLCNAKRPTRRNGAVIELIVEERRLVDGGGCGADGGSGGAAGAGLGVSDGIEEPDPTGITR